MRKCPNRGKYGVMLSSHDLGIVAAALELAIESVRMDINSNTRPNPISHDAEYKRWERSIKESLRIYQTFAQKLRKVTA